MDRKIINIFVMVFLIGAFSSTTAFAHTSIRSAKGLVKRIIPKKSKLFTFYKIEKDNGLDVFEITQRNGKIAIGGNSTLSMTSGFHWYLKHVAKCHVSWNGDQLKLPKVLPHPTKKIRQTSITKHGFYFNYCTFNYTMAWWGWERWQREIDYMALCGIDMPLAIVGSEKLWLNFLKRFGYSSKEAKKFIAGPAYTAWWLMGNLEGRGGPVTDGWVEQQSKLQKKILKRMRSFGMRPALPGFVGIVPTTLAKKKKGTHVLPQGGWAGGHTRPHVLHPDDPLFAKMATAWYEELEKLYGKADVFAGDLFHEGGHTHGLNVGHVAKTVQKYMLDYNPKSIWTIQGWGGNPKPRLLSGLKKENTLVVELCSEFWRNWERSRGFSGFPWTFSTIIMYGGNVGLHGRLDTIANNLNAALASNTKPTALGATWESIEVNPVVMDFLWDMKWREQCPDLNEWVQDYAVRRYGMDTPQLREAWEKILSTAYGSYPGLRRPQESLLCAPPSLNVKKASPYSASCKIFYDQREFRDALKLLLTASKKAGKTRTYRFDCVDITRQFVANVSQLLYRDMVEAFKDKDLERFEKVSAEFLTVFDDQDRLLASEPMYMLGKWLHDARNIAPNKTQAAQNELSARRLITSWTDKKSGLDNYAWKEWSGMMKNYYKPRWQLFVNELSRQLKGRRAKRVNYYAVTHAWTNKTLKQDFYPVKPKGNPVKIAKEMLKKYGPILDKLYRKEKKAVKADFIGTWEYKQGGTVSHRVLAANGKLSLFKNGKEWPNWKGFSWSFKNGKAVLKRANGSVFGSTKLEKPGLVEFSGGIRARRIETGRNKEAEEAVDL